ncbi:MAG: hypothetical protein ACLRPV_07085 [Lacrimispora saccharolytica]
MSMPSLHPKHPSCQWLSMEQAVKHCTQGIGIWEWASNDCGEEPDAGHGLLR